MSFDEPPTPADPPEGTPPRRRRTPRSWSSPASSAERTPGRSLERFDRPISESAWGFQGQGGRRTRSGPGPGSRPEDVAFNVDAENTDVVSAVEALSNDVQSQLAVLRAAIAEAAAPSDTSLVSGAELAASIQTLGAALGNGIASLLSDHRALLARDVEAAADRILDELGQRLRTATTQNVEGVEERLRHVTSKGFSNMGEQLELRLDQLQADVTGLRAVMLEIPDQTAVTSRLDQLAENVSGGRQREGQRLSPGVTAAIERAVAGPIGRLEASVASLAATVEDLDARVAAGEGSGSGSTAEALQELVAEMAALRRRISLRPDAPVMAEVAEEPAETEEAEAEAVPEIAASPAKPARATKATKAAKAPGRRRRTIS